MAEDDHVSSGRVLIEELPADQLAELAPLWDSLREHHLKVAPDWLPPAYNADESWHRRSRQYRAWLADSDSFVLVARRGRALSDARSFTCAAGHRSGPYRSGPESWRRSPSFPETGAG